MTHEHLPTPLPRRRDIHLRPRAHRAFPRLPRARWDRRVASGAPAALALAALLAGLVPGMSASADAPTTDTPAPTASVVAAATPAGIAAAPGVVAEAQVALERAERLTTESRAIAAKQRKLLKARSKKLRELMAERTEAPVAPRGAAAASRAGEREPVDAERASGDDGSAATKDTADRAAEGGPAEVATDAATRAASEADAKGTAANGEPATDETFEDAPATDETSGPTTNPAVGGPLLASASDGFMTPAPADVALAGAGSDPAHVAASGAGGAALATSVPAALPTALPTGSGAKGAEGAEKLKRATDALTEVIRDVKTSAVDITPAPETPREILAAQIRAARKAAPELAKHAKSLRGLRNGEIPGDSLCQLSFSRGETLRCDAAEQLERLDKAYRARFGRHLEIRDSYRSYGAQVATKASRGYLAAVPGYSNHGWAVAVDLGGGVQRFGSAQHEWMRKNGRAFGWVNPDWAQADGRKPEAWHWEYKGI